MAEVLSLLLTLTVFDAAIECDPCEQWNRPQAPFQIYGNTWYVGTGGISAILIDTEEGLVLLDGGLPQSAEVIVDNIIALGFRPKDIRYIGLSHAHFDHAGGIAALQRLSGATVLASHDAAAALRAGGLQENDPQFGGGMTGQTYPAVAEVTAVTDGWEIRIGDFRMIALHTPGHTWGGVSWAWQSCENNRCRDIVYVDSLAPISRQGYRYADGLGDALRATLDRIAGLDCDIMLSTHDSSFGMHEKLQLGRQAFVDGSECRKHAKKTGTNLDNRLDDEHS
jgi:metallo-beta-lactamase class B